MTIQTHQQIRMIPIDRIDILNPRGRDNKTFNEIVENIDAVGLKKPITVATRCNDNGEIRYALACGEGRLKGMRALGEALIPALVIDGSDDELFLISLAENIARRECGPSERLHGIWHLHERGYSNSIIANKTGLSVDYVSDLLHLMRQGEERLLVAVMKRRIPIRAAVEIARADEAEVQQAMQTAYEEGALTARQLGQARRVFERRRTHGRTLESAGSPRPAAPNAASLVKAYQAEVERYQILERQAAVSRDALLLARTAMRRLLADDQLVRLLEREGLSPVPHCLGTRP